MIDLSTNYLGLKLKNPLVASASPLSKKVEQVKRMEEAGIAAVVMYSDRHAGCGHHDAAPDAAFGALEQRCFGQAIRLAGERGHRTAGIRRGFPQYDFVCGGRAAGLGSGFRPNVFLADLTPPEQRTSGMGDKAQGPLITVAREAIAVPDPVHNRLEPPRCGTPGITRWARI